MDWTAISVILGLAGAVAMGAWAIIKWFHRVDGVCNDAPVLKKDLKALADTVGNLSSKVSEIAVGLSTWQANMNSMLVLLGRRHDTPEFDALADKFKAGTISKDEGERLATLLRNNVIEGRVPVAVCGIESRPCAGVRLADALLLAQVESWLGAMK